MAAGGEYENGDHLIMIEDSRVATACTVEAIRTFDHFHFRVAAQAADAKREVLKLQKPRQDIYAGHIKERDRLLGDCASFSLRLTQ